jgi:hypothetical protein
MPLYKFELREGSAPVADGTGVQLPDHEHASAYAKEVARELMHGREAQTRSWRLDVHEHEGEWVFELPFAAIDPSLDHLAPELRSTVELVCDSRRSWQEIVHATQATVRESRALVARSRGQPYLVSIAGQRTIR